MAGRSWRRRADWTAAAAGPAARLAGRWPRKRPIMPGHSCGTAPPAPSARLVRWYRGRCRRSRRPVFPGSAEGRPSASWPPPATTSSAKDALTASTSTSSIVNDCAAYAPQCSRPSAGGVPGRGAYGGERRGCSNRLFGDSGIRLHRRFCRFLSGTRRSSLQPAAEWRHDRSRHVGARPRTVGAERGHPGHDQNAYCARPGDGSRHARRRRGGGGSARQRCA